MGSACLRSAEASWASLLLVGLVSRGSGPARLGSARLGLTEFVSAQARPPQLAQDRELGPGLASNVEFRLPESWSSEAKRINVNKDESSITPA